MVQQTGNAMAENLIDIATKVSNKSNLITKSYHEIIIKYLILL